MRTRLSVPVPVLVLLLVAARLLGSVGSATAAGVTKKTVKKIAAKVLAKQAPQLSVAHAATAGSATTAASAATATTATTAGTAGSATTAATAGNANQLGGQGPAAYRDLGVSTGVNVDTAVNFGTNQLGGLESITVPAGIGYLEVTVSASFSGGNANVALWYQLDGNCLASGPAYLGRARGNTTTPSSIGTTYLVGVAAGDHTLRMCTSASNATTAHTASLVAVTVGAAGD